jgi:hypothetical protein
VSDDTQSIIDSKLWRIAQAVTERVGVDATLTYDAMLRLATEDTSGRWASAFVTGDDEQLIALFSENMPKVIVRTQEVIRPELALVDRALVDGTDSLTPEERETVRKWIGGGAE